MSYEIRLNGNSRSFPSGDAFFDGATADADLVLLLGTPSATVVPEVGKTAILVELDTECLGVHTGESAGEEGSSVLGFARYRNGNDPPSNLIELVRQPNSDEDAIAAATTIVTFDFSVAPVPEPAAGALQVAALFSLLCFKRIREKGCIALK